MLGLVKPASEVRLTLGSRSSPAVSEDESVAKASKRMPTAAMKESLQFWINMQDKHVG